MALKFRRGTTAQQSGSLAFGEPFVNTTLGTLLVGGDNGDIQLATAGTSSVFVGASVSASTFISGSSLKITGNAVIDGNLTLGGAITIGDATADTINIVASLSSSLVPSNDNVFNIGSTSYRYANVYATTISASAYTGLGNLTTYSTSVASRVNTIETAGYAVSSSVASATATSVSASLATATSYSASAAVIDNAQDVKITSLQTNILSASVFTTFSTSVDSRLDSVELLSASANTAYAKLSGNNTYNGTQTVTGSVYVSGDLVVQGSSSLQNITASAVDIGTNTILLNTDSPSVRFGGISVRDSGSNAGTGSLWWDSVENHWIYEHPADSGAPYNSAILISGPKNSGSLGEEVGLMTGFVPVASGDDHITNSIISASLSKVTIQGDLDVTLGISASSIVGLGHVSTYSASVASRVNTIETTYATSASIATATANSISTLSGSVASATATSISTLSGSVASATATSISTLSGSVKAVTDILAVSSSVASATGNSISTLSGSVKSVTDALSGRVTTLEGKDISVTLTGDVTGTGTITDLGNVSFATTIAANSVALGTDTSGDYVASLVAGTGVTLTNNSGESATPTIAIGQSVATNATPTFGNLTINGTITATGDITAYYTSDKRHKNNIQIIPNALQKVSKLNGVTWEWNDDVNEVTKATPKTGLIAQEVQEVLPEVVVERENGYLGLDYSKMMGLMVEAIKEQQQHIHNLTLEIEELKKQKGL